MGKAVYDEKNIKTLHGLDGIRQKAGMYVGSVSKDAIKHLALEVLGNSLDEHHANEADMIIFTMNLDKQEFSVEDNGRGIPETKIEDIFTKLHTSGKFDKNSYKYSIGTNGVGVKCVNALSEYTIVDSFRNGKHYHQEFSQGKTTTALETKGKTNKKGTVVTWKPEISLFKEITNGFQEIIDDTPRYYRILEQTCFLNPNLSIKFVIIKDKKMSTKTFNYKNGLSDYIVKEAKDIIGKPVLVSSIDNDMEFECIFTWTKSYNEEKIISFVNGIETKDGGTHEKGFKRALTESMGKLLKDKLSKKDGVEKIDGDDIREGLVAIISVKHINPVFASQSKDKLTNTDIEGFILKNINTSIPDHFNKNKNDFKAISDKIILSIKGRLASIRAKEKIINPDKKGLFTAISSLSKFTNCSNTNPKDKELLILEGNSAGGSAVQARDPKSQAIYRLRGKILKTQDVDLATILKNKEISDIVNILGCNIGKNFDYSKLKYDRIIIAADADVDGLHITVLVLTLFINFMPELIQKGHVYIATPPLFKIIEGKKEIFIQNKVDYSKYILNKIDSLYDIGLIKNNKVSLLKTFNDFDYSNYRKDIESIALKYSCNKSLIEWIIFNDITKNNPFIELDVNNNILEGMINDSFQYLDIDKIDKNDIDTIKTKYPDAINLRIRKKNDKFKSNFNLYDDILTVLNTTEPKHRTRFKGIGEMTPEQLATSTLDIRTRKLIQVTINDINDANDWFHCLMNDKAEPRKQFVKDYQYLIDKNDIEM